MFRGDHWIQASRLVKKVGYLPQTVKNCVYEYHLKRVDSEPTLFAHFRLMNTSSGILDTVLDTEFHISSLSECHGLWQLAPHQCQVLNTDYSVPSL